MEQIHVLIAGAGFAGLSAAIWCRRLGLPFLLLEKEGRMGGQLHAVKNKIQDLPPGFYENGLALLSELMNHPLTVDLPIRFGEEIVSVDSDQKQVHTNKNTYRVDYLVLATGALANRIPALEGDPRVLPPWFSTSAEGEVLQGKRILIIGGGDRAMESACNLSPIADHIWIAVRKDRLKARREWAKRLSDLPNITLFLETEVIGTRSGQTYEVLLNSANKQWSLSVDYVLPRIGVRGNTEPFSFLQRDPEGFLICNEWQQTSVEWIYAIGDAVNGSDFASLSLASGQAMKAIKSISLQERV